MLLKVMKLRKNLRSLAIEQPFAHAITVIFFAAFFLNIIFIMGSHAAPVPTDLRVIMSSAGNNSLVLSWSQPSGPVTGYWLSRSGQLIKINTTSLNVQYVDTDLVSGQNYIYKVASSDAATLSPWSLKASGITKNSGLYTKPHAPFTDNTNMCQACHSIHIAPTPYKTLYKRYTNLLSGYTEPKPGQYLPDADLCFNCHDGTAASGENIKNSYNAEYIPWVEGEVDGQYPGHRTRATANYNIGWKNTLTVPAGYQLSCMTCHDAHVSNKGNYKLLADDLYNYAKTTTRTNQWNSTGGWSTGTTWPWEMEPAGRVKENGWERCTICHHGAPSTDGSGGNNDSVMIVQGIDMYAMKDRKFNGTDCGGCHGTPHNVKIPASRGTYPKKAADNCGCHVNNDPNLLPMKNNSTTSIHFMFNDMECLRCHNNHDDRENPTRAFNVWRDSTTTQAGNANYDYTTALSPTAAKQGGLCLSCHQDRLSSSRPGGTSNDTTYVDAIKTTAYSESGHDYFDNGTFLVGGYDADAPITETGTGQFRFRGNCIKCHRASFQGSTSDAGGKYGPHVSANRALTIKREEVLCLDCHKPGPEYWASRQLPTVSWRISQAFATQVNWGHAPFMNSQSIDRHRTTEGISPNWMPAGSRHVECADCHNIHEVTQSYDYSAALPYTGSAQQLETPYGNYVAGSLKSVWGVYPTTNWDAIPTAPNTAIAYTRASADPVGRLYRTEAASKEAYICFKCHSAYAYGTGTKPDLPSKVPAGTSYAAPPNEDPVMTGQGQSDILEDFNPNNAAYHPILAIGRFQPTPGQNPNWNTSNFRLAPSYGVTGFANNFVPPFNPTSLIACSDCHSHSSSSYSRGYYTGDPARVNAWDFPRGPHGSSRRWILKRLDRSIRYQRWDNSWVDYSTYPGAPPGDATLIERFLCLNCHRADVYWGSNPGGKVLAEAGNLARVTHIPAVNIDSNHANATRNVWGIGCRNCHGGFRAGSIHGMSTQAASQSSSPPLGRRLIGGSNWTAYTVSASQISCWMGGTSPIGNCSRSDTGKSGTWLNYYYSD